MTNSLTLGGVQVDTADMRDLRESKGLLLLGGIVAFLVVLGSAVGITAAVNDSTAWSALPVGWIAVWVAALVGITGYLAWSESAARDSVS